MTKPIPYFDYEGFFGEEYVYAEEREILLPPMIAVEEHWRRDFILRVERDNKATGKLVRWYDVALNSFDADSMWEEDKSKSDDQSDRNYLKAHAAEAAKALDDLAQTHDWKTSPLADEKHVYWKWKRAYRRVLAERLKQIYSAEFPEK
jgi:hypothetical protein